MKQLKIAGGFLVSSSCFVTLLMYYWNRSTLPDRTHGNLKQRTDSPKYIGTPIYHMPLSKILPEKHRQNNSFEFKYKPGNVLNTVGCKIPEVNVDYSKYWRSSKKMATTCGKRAVFLKKVNRDQVRALIKPRIMKKYLRKTVIFDCCYRYIKRSTKLGQEGNKIRFSKCVKFQDNAIINLESDFVNVKCFDYGKRNLSHTIYDDVYAFTVGMNASNQSQDKCNMNYNVLMIGMDSMSSSRFHSSMPRTIKYFVENRWFDFRGYHKVEDNTFPNLMAVLTGLNIETISDKCANRMDQCADLLIWSRFKKAGYVTAYGEDYLRLPDTFADKYSFKMPPTDHYMRPFFLKGETELNNKSLVCAGKVPSGLQLLNYALDFANTYRNDKFFGLFWMNSFSHNVNSKPQDADAMLENFFLQLTKTRVLENTFVIFFSDHGIRFGDIRLKVDSYYDERLPFLQLYLPDKFRTRYPVAVRYLTQNQHRLVTPYDLHNTLVDINEISECRGVSGEVLDACPKCRSMFTSISDNRTCQDVSIHDKWCSCHKLLPVAAQNPEADKTVQLVVSHVKNMTKSIRTKRCWGCANLSLKNVIRTHFFYKHFNTSLYYVVAFAMTPGNVSYEATVLFKEGQNELVGPVSRISPYRGLGKCTITPKDRLFCVCQKIDNC